MGNVFGTILGVMKRNAGHVPLNASDNSEW